MMFVYNKLWKLLIDKSLKKSDLRKVVAPVTVAKLSKNEYVSMEVLDKLCSFLNCDISDIAEHKKDDSKPNSI